MPGGFLYPAKVGWRHWNGVPMAATAPQARGVLHGTAGGSGMRRGSEWRLKACHSK